MYPTLTNQTKTTTNREEREGKKRTGERNEENRKEEASLKSTSFPGRQDTSRAHDVNRPRGDGNSHKERQGGPYTKPST